MHGSGAALDVFDREPLPMDSPFYRLENVSLSPHCADHTHDSLDQAMKLLIGRNWSASNNGSPL